MNSPYQAPFHEPRRSWFSRNWFWAVPVGCLSPVLLCGGFVTVIALSVFGLIKSITPYNDSLVMVQQDVNAIENMGEPIEAGFVVTGNVHVSGSGGNADFSYPVSGPKGGGWVYVVAEKENGKWTTKSVILESKGERFTLVSSEELPNRIDANDEETVEPSLMLE